MSATAISHRRILQEIKDFARNKDPDITAQPLEVHFLHISHKILREISELGILLFADQKTQNLKEESTMGSLVCPLSILLSLLPCIS